MTVWRKEHESIQTFTFCSFPNELNKLTVSKQFLDKVSRLKEFSLQFNEFFDKISEF